MGIEMRARRLAAVWLLGFVPTLAAPTVEEVRTALDDGRYAEAAAAGREALEALAPPDGSPEESAATAAELIGLVVEAMIRDGRSKDPAAIELAERGVAVNERVHGSDSAEMAGALRLLAIALESAARYDEAEGAYRRALTLAERAHGPESDGVTPFLNSYGVYLKKTGRLEEARAKYERALAIGEAVHGPDHPALCRVLYNLANLLRQLGELELAEAHLLRAVPLFEREFGPDHPVLSAVSNALGQIQRVRGDFAAAEDTYRVALERAERTLGKDNPRVGVVLSNLGHLYREMGDYDAALRALERASAIRRATLPEVHPEIADDLQSLGSLRRLLNDLHRALEALDASIAMLERIYDGGHVNLVEGEIERARVLADLGRPEEAERGLNRAIEMGRELLGAEHLLVGNALISLGRLRADRGDLGAGIAAVQEGLRYREAAFGASSPRLVDSLLTYAHLLERAGRGDEAAATLERARSAAETGLGAGHPTAVRTMASLAGLTWRRGRAGAALGLAREASLAVERELRGTVGHLPERQALGYLARRETPETVLFSGLLHDEPRRAEWLRAAWDWTLRTRGLVLDELSERHRAGIAAESAEVGKAWERVAETRRRLALLWARGPGGDDEAYAAAVRLAQEEKESAETALSRASERFRREQALQSTTLDDVAGALPEDSALVEIVRVGVAPAGAGRSVSRDLALVMQPGGVLTWRDLGPSDRVDGAVRAWRDELSRSAPDGRAGRLDALEAAGAALRSLVWDPIEDALGDEPETVFLVPDGPLHVVDLAALPAADGSFLAESGPWFHLLGSARDLVRHRGTAGPAGSTVLAVGGPDFDLAPRGSGPAPAALVASARTGEASDPRHRCDSLGAARWDPLPSAEREVRRVAGLFGNDRDVRVLVGGQATERAFRDAVVDAGVVHLATHGFFLEDCGRRAGADRAVYRENPLLLSGIVLAGANRSERASEGDDDGILTAEELATLDLTRVDLAVLSSCDTGLGTVATGEGVFGLRRAFEMAGVDTVVMSLWPVSDRWSARWMAAFHERRIGGAPVMRAARAASLASLERLRATGRAPHPYLWAGFVTAGGWR